MPHTRVRGYGMFLSIKIWPEIVTWSAYVATTNGAMWSLKLHFRQKWWFSIVFYMRIEAIDLISSLRFATSQREITTTCIQMTVNRQTLEATGNGVSAYKWQKVVNCGNKMNHTLSSKIASDVNIAYPQLHKETYISSFYFGSQIGRMSRWRCIMV